MCNACGFLCCAYDGFSGCGCDDCEEPECWTSCDHCEASPVSECECDVDGDYPEFD